MLQNGSAYISGKDTEQYAALSQQMEAYRAAISSFDQAEENARVGLERETIAAANNAAAVERDGQAKKRATQHSHVFANALKSVARAAMRIPGAISSMIGKLRGFLSMSKKSSNATNALIKGLTGLGRMLKTHIKRTFISSIFKSLTAGIHNLANYSSAFNASMSSMKNSMTGLSGNIAVTASNLINTLAPAISTIIDWVSQAISYLNAFFALLQGKSVFTRAKKATDDYASSLSGAGGAAKDLKNQVYGFDELNKASDSGGGGGGGGSGSGGAMFEDVGIDAVLPNNIRNLFENIKNAVMAGEWSRLGAILAGQLNEIIATAAESVQGWGEKIGNAISNAIATADGFISTTDWVGIGTVIKNFLVGKDGNGGILGTLDLSSAGGVIAKLIDGVAASAATLLDAGVWGKIGTKIS